MGKITEKLGYGAEGSAIMRTAFGMVEQGDGVQFASFSVVTLPAASQNIRRLVWVTDGADGSPCLAVSDGTDWLRIDPGSPVSLTMPARK